MFYFSQKKKEPPTPNNEKFKGFIAKYKTVSYCFLVQLAGHEDAEEGDVVRGCERGARHACMEEAVVAAGQRRLLVFRVC